METNERLDQHAPSLFSRYGAKMGEAYDRALREALAKHAVMHNPVAFWENGEVVVRQIEGTIGVWDNDEDDVYGELLK